MSPRTRWIMAAALVAVVSGTAMAGVVRDRMGNPGVQAGGQSLPHHATPPPIPYSLIGALAEYAVWPWRWLIGITPFHPHVRHAHFRRFDVRHFEFRSFDHHHRPHPPY